MRKIIFLIITCFLFPCIVLRADNGMVISGKITNEAGQPLSEVNVFEVGVNNQVQSNSTGVYSISIQHSAALLRFSYSGYEMKELKVNHSANRNIVMKVVDKGASSILKYGSSDEAVQINFQTVLSKENGKENSFQNPSSTPATGFSVNVDGPSYSNIYRYGQNGEMPSEKMVNTEEMINYFQYDYPMPEANATHPFTVTTELSACPWNREHKLLLIGLQGKVIPAEQLPASNLVFLIDASGSMNDAAKLPLVKASMKLLAEQMRSRDKVSVVVYAGSAGLALPATSGSKKATIEKAIDALEPGGYTAGADGIRMAYKIAKQNFIKAGNNRIILCTDGNFNVGISNTEAIDNLIAAERKTGVLLSVLGFGNGNRQMVKMKKWAEIGNGNHHFINGLNEAKRLFVNEFASTLYTIAKDVKPIVKFNPSKVQAYRLIGYDGKAGTKTNSIDSIFADGELGSGHTVTALYEINPFGTKFAFSDTFSVRPPLIPAKSTGTADTNIAEVQIEYIDPENDEQKQINTRVKDSTQTIETSSNNFRFAAAVAEFGLLLKNSAYKQKANYKDVIKLAKTALGNNKGGVKSEFVTLVENIKRVDRLTR